MIPLHLFNFIHSLCMKISILIISIIIYILVATEQQWYPSVAAQEGYFNDGFDIVYTYDTQNAVIARTNIDKQRGIVPP